MLETIVENESVAAEILHRPSRSPYAIRIADDRGHAFQSLREQARFVAPCSRIGQNALAVRDDYARARIGATITARQDANAAHLARDNTRDPFDQRRLSGAPGRDVANADDGSTDLMNGIAPV